MKPEQQRIAMAKARGWEYVEDEYGYPPNAYRGIDGEGMSILPDCLNDLNACHKVLLGLTEAQVDSFQQHLLEIMAPGTHWSDMHNVPIFLATPRQWTKAILKTLKLWEDES